MNTTVASATRAVTIAPDRPFVLIGERINPTGRSRLAAEMAAGDLSRVRADALAQAAAGAHILDVNAGVPGCDESSLLVSVVQAVTDACDLPLCLDSANPAALEAALSVYQGKALINSTTGEEAVLDRLLALARRHDAAIICLCCDERGPSPDPSVRLDIARRIADRAAHHGVPLHDLVMDPLVMAVSADTSAGPAALETIRLLRAELGVNLTCGASNVSFGLPDRPALNAAFLAMAMHGGLNSAITNPLDPTLRTAILAGDLLLGRDDYAARWIKDFRRRNAPSR
jgi:5-methyltetrahydrofolate--homocysteine methyltransferase